MLEKQYPAKIIVLGEYTVLSGSRALVIPFNEFSGHWSFDDKHNESSSILKSFCDHKMEHLIHLDTLKKDLEKGLWFDSNIPQGYGVGSSGALIAAIFDVYGKSSQKILELKETLGRMEDYFHGSSSGIDPLVSYLEKPIVIDKKNESEVEVLKNIPSMKGFFLVNTNRPRQAGKLIEIYREKMKDSEFKKGCMEILSRDVNFAIDCLLKNDRENLFHHLWHISKFQWDFFPEMIPTQMRGLWTRGIESGDYVLKLCGAGGGGFLLGYSQKLNIQELQNIFGSHDLREL